ncbi:MAG: hypothetical protein P8M13_03515 [Luminiphilus sp.]|nr:hypothetical protein [Luminiphilus sp.]
MFTWHPTQAESDNFAAYDTRGYRGSRIFLRGAPADPASVQAVKAKLIQKALKPLCEPEQWALLAQRVIG